MWTRVQFKTNAKQLFYRNYWPCVAVTALTLLFTGAAGYSGNVNVNINGYDNSFSYEGSYGYVPEIGDRLTGVFAAITIIGVLIAVIAALLAIFVGNVFVVGGNSFFIKNRTEKAAIGEILMPFKSGHYGNVVLTMFLMELFIGLWTLLLIVPGIIKTYEYLMVPYILAENPGMDRREAFAISKRMMDGEKWNAFVLGLSFIGWYLLSVCTCGILSIFYVAPYEKATFAELYTYNKIKAYNEGYIR